MKPDPTGSRHDAETESIEILQEQAHAQGRCKPGCAYCAEEMYEADMDRTTQAMWGAIEQRNLSDLIDQLYAHNRPRKAR